MTRMTGPDCAVMSNLINTHTHTHTHIRTLPTALLHPLHHAPSSIHLSIYLSKARGSHLLRIPADVLHELLLEYRQCLRRDGVEFCRGRVHQVTASLRWMHIYIDRERERERENGGRGGGGGGGLQQDLT